VKLRIPVVTLVAFALSAPAAQADTAYGGAVAKGGRQTGPAIGLLVQANGNVRARVMFTYRCKRRTLIYNQVVKVAGRANGASFTADGSRRLSGGAGRVRFTLTGTLAPDTATGKLRMRNGCVNRTQAFVLRAAPAPGGAPVVPPSGMLLYGLTSQTVSGLPLPLTVRVTKQGRVYVYEYGRASCGGFSWEVSNAMSSTAIKPDGTFARTEHWSIRYRDGSRERYTVNSTGRFLADGATGTFRIRLTYRKGRVHERCDTGVINWTARP
jgi:hypothetical protein